MREVEEEREIENEINEKKMDLPYGLNEKNN